MKLLIITGMSGAGKASVAHNLEDMGYYCVDNIPPAIIPSFVSLSEMGNGEPSKIAVVTDVRVGEMFGQIDETLEKLRQNDIDYKILFLDSSDEVLTNRFRENRRKHPLCNDETLFSNALALEREALKKIKEKSDFVIDTSMLSVSALKATVSDIVLGDTNEALSIVCKSFGFKYGVDSEADIMFDVRCLPNPFYVSELKKKTGLDSEVREYIFGFDVSRQYLEKLMDFIEFSVPLYVKEGKSRLVISFGCTGGKHRSITFAQTIASFLSDKGYNVSVVHRDLEK